MTTHQAAPCAACGRPSFRMHGLVGLLRRGSREVTVRAACAAYCGEHEATALNVARAELQREGRVVATSGPYVVRSDNEACWRAGVMSRAAQQWMAAIPVIDLTGATGAGCSPRSPRR